MKKKRNYWVWMLVLIICAGWGCGEAEEKTPPDTPEAEPPQLAFPVWERPPYEEIRIQEFPAAVQCWTFRRFTFMETLDKVKQLGLSYLEAYPGQDLSPRQPDIKFNHRLKEKHIESVKQKLKETGIRLINYGVVGFDNQEESMQEVFDFARKMGIRTIVTEPAFDDFSLLDKMVRKTGIQVAIHNHPEPSKYAHPETVQEHISGLDPRIGVCADTGHWMRSGVDPVEALRMLKGRILDVHLKDLNAFAEKDAVDVPFGQGEAGIRDILAELTYQDYDGVLAIEYEDPAAAENPLPPIREGLEYLEDIMYYKGYQRLLGKSGGRYHKHGWNHYGPGYFLLEPEAGILKAQGGMGLFWYSREEFGDFVLELDFMSEQEDTNSGIFLRIPEMPAGNEYIHHSFEIQIYHAGEGKHKTGAVYDVKAPDSDGFNPAGEWNHFKITFRGDHLMVELNETVILDWTARPGGKVRDFADRGYIGLQNHDSRSPVYFRNIYLKEL